MDEETKRERVFYLRVTAMDVAVMALSSTAAVVLLGILITHDLMFGIIAAFGAISWRLATNCLTFNPDKYVEQKSEEQEDSPEDPPEEDRLGTFVSNLTINLTILCFGLLMISKGSLYWYSQSGEAHRIFDFTESGSHVGTAGWLTTFFALYFTLKHLYHWIKDRIARS